MASVLCASKREAVGPRFSSLTFQLFKFPVFQRAAAGANQHHVQEQAVAPPGLRSLWVMFFSSPNGRCFAKSAVRTVLRPPFALLSIIWPVFLTGAGFYPLLAEYVWTGTGRLCFDPPLRHTTHTQTYTHTLAPTHAGHWLCNIKKHFYVSDYQTKCCEQQVILKHNIILAMAVTLWTPYLSPGVVNLSAAEKN